MTHPASGKRPLITRLGNRLKYEIDLLLDRGREAWLALQIRYSTRPRNAAPAVTRPFIVSLTTYGERLKLVHFTIETLLRQTVQPERLILWIDEKLQDKDIPATLQRQIRRGLEVRRTPDLGPYTKIIPALQAFPKLPTVTVDDDIQYPPDLFARLYTAFSAEPDYIHCYRAHIMRLTDNGEIKPYIQWELETQSPSDQSAFLFPTGCGGVIYPPQSLHPDVTNIKLFQSLCAKNDDVWLKAMALLKGTKSKRLPVRFRRFHVTRHSQKKALKHVNLYQGGNDVTIKNVFDYYKLKDRLRTPG